MASLRDADITGNFGSGVINTIKLSSVVTGDTVTYQNPMKSFMYALSTADTAVVAYSASTQLFTITVSNTPNITIWILN